MRIWKAKWCKIQEAKLSSHSTNFLSRSREISIKLTKIKSRSTDFLSRSRHILIKLNNNNYNIQQISIQRQESITSSSRNELPFLSTKRFSQFSRIIRHRPHIPVVFYNASLQGQAPIAITLNVANSRINQSKVRCQQPTQTLSTKCFPTMQ